ncbi:hypothetical protein [Sedimenticola sp.]|uniref:hypothetical protein n=1 Tax=Sedimenticola sp. TaxID=1940285 RepID=UPI003D15309D
MNIDHEEIVLGENGYYRIICLLSEVESEDKWLGRIRVIRKDTGEYVNKGFTVFENSKESVLNIAERKVEKYLLPELVQLGKPTDWNSRVRCVLVKCKKLHQYVLDFGSLSVDIMHSNTEDEDYLVKYSLFWKNLVKETIALSRAIETLNSEERLDLLTLPSDAIKDPSDAWNLEELDLRIMSFDFFSNPTEQERDVHVAQKKKLADRFAELDWK